MKKTLFAFFTFALLLLAIPGQSHAQCSSDPNGNPCFSLAENGPCVCYPNGKLRVWIASNVIMEAKSTLDQGSCRSLWFYLDCYYRTGEVNITYLGGNWQSGQTFEVSRTGGGVIITTIDGF